MGLKDKVAQTFLGKGVKVAIADDDGNASRKAEGNLAGHGDVAFQWIDVSVEEDFKKGVAPAVEKFGHLNIMFNHAGIGLRGETHKLSYEDYHKVIRVNQDSVFYGSKHAIPEMQKAGGGAIINTASILGSVGEPTAFAYNASKGAINLMTKSVALQYAKDNIRVSAVAQGYVDASMVNKDALGEFYDALVDKHPIGKFGKPEEIAHAVVFLAEKGFTTGTTLLVDGGYTAQ